MGSVQVTFNGTGPLRGLQTIATAQGVVRGKVGNPLADPPLRPDGKLNVGEAVGQGAHFFPFPSLPMSWQCLLPRDMTNFGSACSM